MYELWDMVYELQKIIDEYKSKVLNDNRKMSETDRFLYENSLAPLIGTICDWRVNADIAWSVPYYLSRKLKKKGYPFRSSSIIKVGEDNIKEFLKETNTWICLLD